MSFPFSAPKPKEKNVGRFCHSRACHDKWGNTPSMIWCWCSRESATLVYCPECFDKHPCGRGEHGPDCPYEDGDLT